MESESYVGTLERALADYFTRVDRGESIDLSQWVAAHPELEGELRKFLTAERILHGYVHDRQQVEGSDGGDRSELDTGTRISTHGRPASLMVRCPNCQAAERIAADSRLTTVRCKACGSQFSLVDGEGAAAVAPVLASLGRFELISRLGMGAFGSVWKARDKTLDRLVAIKIPRAHGLTQEEQERFIREARAAAQLRHPNIVSAHEVGHDGDSLYIVSDFVPGVSLAQWLDGKPLTQGEAAALVAKIADALHYAHEQGVVHRDLKPANILIVGDGQPHIMDFGLARRDAGEVTVTLDGHVLGTPAYMSPEQAQGESHGADRRSDIYSLGVLLFQCLTGELPFRGNVRMLLQQVVHDEPPSPRRLNANIKRDLETITLKCLEKVPGRRYQTAEQLADDLRHFLRGERISARPIGQLERAVRWIGRNKSITAAAAAMAIVLMAATTVSAMFAVRATRQAALARAREAEAIEAKRVEELTRRDAQNLLGLFASTLSRGGQATDGKAVTVAEVLASSERELENRLADQPRVLARILAAIGEARRGLGLLPEAIATLERSKSLYEGAYGLDHEDTLAAYNNLAIAYHEAGEMDQSIALLEVAVERANQLLSDTDVNRLMFINNLAAGYGRTGQIEKALPLIEEALEIRRTRFGAENESTLVSMTNLAATYLVAGRLDKAISLGHETLDLHHKVFGSLDPRTAKAASMLGIVYLESQQYEEAISFLEDALKIVLDRFSSRHPLTDEICNNLTQAYELSGQPQRAVRVYEIWLANNDHLTARTRFARLLIRDDLGELRDVPRAKQLADEACELSDYQDIEALATLAAVHAELHEWDEAIKRTEQALELAEQSAATAPEKDPDAESLLAELTTQLTDYRAASAHE